MGDRISIAFHIDGYGESVALFSHWNGISLKNLAEKYVKDLKKAVKKNKGCGPLDRLEPNTVMVDFIRILTKDLPCVDGNFYLGKDGDDGDNSDNGHFLIELD